MTIVRQRRSARRGAVLIWFSFFGMALILILALAADSAHVYLAAHQLQNAADAGALAGALKVRVNIDNAAHNRAVNVAGANKANNASVQLAANLGNAAGGDVVIGVYNFNTNTFSPTLTSPNAVKVTARRTTGSPGGALPLIFGQIAHINNAQVSRTATAVCGGNLAAGLILLKPTGTAIDLKGSGNTDKIQVINGGIQVNSDSTNAVSWNGHANITADSLYVYGNQTNLNGAFSIGKVGINSPPVPDPLANLPVPTPGPTRTNSGTTLLPGYYPSGISGTRNLTSGEYYVRGGLSGNLTSLSGGVMIYVETGNVNANLKLTAMTTGTYAGVAVFMARNNAGSVSLGGNAGTTSLGTIYVPAATVDMHGTPDVVANQIIAYAVNMNGTPQIKINYDGRFPALGHQVWLVQ